MDEMIDGQESWYCLQEEPPELRIVKDGHKSVPTYKVCWGCKSMFTIPAHRVAFQRALGGPSV